MVFSSIEFLLFFLPLFLILYGLSPDKIKNAVLLTGSLIFYALGDVKSLPLLMLSVLINYFFGLHLERRDSVRPRKGQRPEVETGQRKKNTAKKKSKKEVIYENYIRNRAERKRRVLFMS